MILRSQQFDDVYFSADDGMMETAHVFLQGNRLPDAWKGRKNISIGETGFGTGLNLLCAWKLFEETSSYDQRLDFISVEKYPLAVHEICKALEPWSDVLGTYMDRYLGTYPLRIAGIHKIHLTNRVSLTLWIGDIADVMPGWDGFQIDAWFLDGFTPAKNPQMWTDEVFAHMARLSHVETTYATFTAAGFVRRGLERVGFTVEKTAGFGRKRDMIRGRFTRHHRIPHKKQPENPLIIGGGLAGTAIAHAFARYGVKPVMLEAGSQLAYGASGGEYGMIDPKLTALPTPQSDYYTNAYAYALRVLQDMACSCPDIDFRSSGGVHLQLDDDKKRRFQGYRDNLGWHADHIRLVDAAEASDITGVSLVLPALYYPDAASVSPRRLSRAMGGYANHRLNSSVARIEKINGGWLVYLQDRTFFETDALYMANGYAIRELLAHDMTLCSIRGQVTYIKSNNNINRLKSNLCFGGYMLPTMDQHNHILGSSFQPWCDETSVNDNDHAENIDRFNRALGREILNQSDVVGGWMGFRTSNRDRFPCVGQIDKNLFVSTAHASHGIISSLLAADILVTQSCGGIIPASKSILLALNPLRFAQDHHRLASS